MSVLEDKRESWLVLNKTSTNKDKFPDILTGPYTSIKNKYLPNSRRLDLHSKHTGKLMNLVKCEEKTTFKHVIGRWRWRIRNVEKAKE